MDKTNHDKNKPGFAGDVGYAKQDDHSTTNKKIDDHSSHDVRRDDHSVHTTKVSDNSQRNLHVDDHSQQNRIGDHLEKGAQKTKVQGDKIEATGVENVVINKGSSNAPLFVIIVLVAIVAIVAVVYMATGPREQTPSAKTTVSSDQTPPHVADDRPSSQPPSTSPEPAADDTGQGHSAAKPSTFEETLKPSLPGGTTPLPAFQMGFGMYRVLPGGSAQFIHAGDSLKSGDGYYFVVRPNADSYVYLFQIDSNNQVFRLFPNKAYKTGQNPIRGNQDKVMPNAAMEYFLDKTSGNEEILLFASRKPIKDLEDLSAGNRASLNLDGRKIRGVAGTRIKDHIHIKSQTEIHQQLLEIGSSTAEFYHRFAFKHD